MIIESSLLIMSRQTSVTVTSTSAGRRPAAGEGSSDSDSGPFREPSEHSGDSGTLSHESDYPIMHTVATKAKAN